MISFLTNSNLTYEMLQGKVSKPEFCGGNYYEFEAIKIIKSNYEFKFEDSAVRNADESIFKYYKRLSQFKSDGKIVIKSPMAIAFSENHEKLINVGIIHHIDKPKSLKNIIYNHLIIKKCKELDYIVVVSAYWKQKLENFGCSNINIIHNSYDTTKYDIKDGDTRGVLNKYNIPTDKPILYIGNALKEKGAEKVYNSLKNKNYTMIMTGKKNELDIPVRCIFFNEQDYRIFLKAADLVLTMSLMNEGWNRVAHEAMLVGTPVIGTGSGGMSDLLINGKQTIVKNFDSLPLEVEKVLQNKKTIGQFGFDYVKSFDTGYFKDKWLTLIENINHKNL